MPGSLEAVLGFAAEHWQTTAGLLAVGVLAYWYFAARQESAGGAANTASAFMGRAERGFGGFFGAVTSILIGVLAIAVTIAGELTRLGVMLDDVVGGAPVVVGHLVWGVISWLGLAGYVPLDPETAGWLFLVLTVAVFVMRFTSARDDWEEVVARDD